MSKNLEKYRKNLQRNKKDERGIVIRNKARSVAQGYTQEEGINYDKVFAPVVRIKAIRLFLAYASFKDFRVYQMDVKSAFLYGKIKEEVYVCQPPGFEDPDFPDRTLFIKRYKGDIFLVQVYVDDIIFGSTKKELCITFEKLMHDKFQMSSMGELTFFLGLQVKKKKYGIFISQDKYVGEILKKFGFTKVQTASTPIETQKPLLKDKDGKEMDVHIFQVNPKERTVNGEVQLQALVDRKKIIITESTVRSDLQLEDADGVDCLPNTTIFEQLTLMSSKTTAWNEFSSTMASYELSHSLQLQKI
ncbi:retrovirus-related pol polyprotein from transposon TNT 1-94 [Tanacetum coccineum]